MTRLEELRLSRTSLSESFTILKDPYYDIMLCSDNCDSYGITKSWEPLKGISETNFKFREQAIQDIQEAIDKIDKEILELKD